MVGDWALIFTSSRQGAHELLSDDLREDTSSWLLGHMLCDEYCLVIDD